MKKYNWKMLKASLGQLKLLHVFQLLVIYSYQKCRSPRGGIPAVAKRRFEMFCFVCESTSSQEMAKSGVYVKHRLKSKLGKTFAHSISI